MATPPEKPENPAAPDYRASLFLPATDFPMKAGLPEAEPQWLAHWEKTGLYARLRTQARGRTPFILHDGPPYANGEIHSGTGLNKILKDFVVRSQTMLGKDAPYVPGWDCHGLPIEWKVEEAYRAQGKSKEDVPIAQLRADCRAFASKWIDVQRAQFKRLGVMGQWDRPYTTMDYRAESVIASELHKFVSNGLLYRGFRPVMWSPVEKTALAEAEVEYHDKQSPQIYVKFPVTPKIQQEATSLDVDFVTDPKNGKITLGKKSVDAYYDEHTALQNAASDLASKHTYIVIWTTTPWTVPGNRAIAYSPDIAYGVYEVATAAEGALAKPGEKLLLADSLASTVAAAAKVELMRIDNADVSALTCAHPLRGRGYDFDVPLLPGAHVTSDTGTGFVHTAPGHGEDDFELMMARDRHYADKNPDAFAIVLPDGSFAPAVPLFAGKRILTPEGKDGDANGAVIKALIEAGNLLAKGSLRHSYPHSWRSKAPVIFRATPQWFVAMDRPFTGSEARTLRELALKAIGDTKWYPSQGANRIGSMVETRPDWVLSRQRAWGVPIAIFVNKQTGKILDDAAVHARIKDIFALEGADAWYTRPASDFLGPDHAPGDYEQVRDILDVWFDSGATHVFTVEDPLYPEWPRADIADLYLEGSDQHRGWFQSSLLENCGTKGFAPYKAVLTHGFVLDEQGRKMSKSIGNTVLPQVIADQNGADILRLWAASSNFTADLRIGADIIKANVDSYRRLRNTIRFMLANLAGFRESERLPREQMPELERYMLARLAELDGLVRAAYETFDFNRVFSTIFAFATNDLSAFYFDIRKDALYCDPVTAARRRAVRTVTDETFRRIVTWFAPILCFTMEEAWTHRFGKDASVHLETFPETPKGWADADLTAKWTRLRALRRVVTGVLEIARAEKKIGASLEAAPVLHLSDAADAAIARGIDFAELAITSGARIETGDGPADAFRLPDVAGAAASFARADGHKCARCWMILPEVGRQSDPNLCVRCDGAVSA